MNIIKQNIPITVIYKQVPDNTDILTPFAASKRGLISFEQYSFLASQAWDWIIVAENSIFASHSCVLFTEFGS